MKIYLLIKPQDYQSADVEIFYDKKSAEEMLKIGRRYRCSNSENWIIREEEV